MEYIFLIALFLSPVLLVWSLIDPTVIQKLTRGALQNPTRKMGVLISVGIMLASFIGIGVTADTVEVDPAVSSQQEVLGEAATPSPEPQVTPEPTVEATATASPVAEVTTESVTVKVTPSPTPTPKPNPSPTPYYAPTPAPTAARSGGGGYTCNCSKTCTQISSCAEAYYQLNVCGCSVRDGDNDGVPCESLCR